MRRLAAAAALCLALTACGSASSPEADLQSRTNDVIEAANAGDAAALRTAAGRLRQEVQAQSANGDITTTKAQRLRVLIDKIAAEAGLLEEQAAPSPAATSERPSPSPSPEDEEEETEAPSPEPSPDAPSPTQAPPSPDVVPSIVVSQEPAAQPTAS